MKVPLGPTKEQRTTSLGPAWVLFTRGTVHAKRDSPLYLEWAPQNIFSPTSAPVDEDEKNEVGERIVTKAIVEQTMEGVSAEEIDPDRVKKHVKNSKNVSMGFDFVEFNSVETATMGTVLDRHALILQLCLGRRDGHAVKKNDLDKSSTKLLVRNLAFEATGKDLKQFSPFDQKRQVAYEVWKSERFGVCRISHEARGTERSTSPRKHSSLWSTPVNRSVKLSTYVPFTGFCAVHPTFTSGD
ncbi:hypothetical protein ACP70R_039858 [Stipagrostis hirtigluma subsp. patula]